MYEYVYVALYGIWDRNQFGLTFVWPYGVALVWGRRAAAGRRVPRMRMAIISWIIFAGARTRATEVNAHVDARRARHSMADRSPRSGALR